MGGQPGAIRRRLVISGRVQGVFFRDAVRQQARKAGVAGWARNLADGTVEIVLEGRASAVEEVQRFCARGPARARVEAVDASDESVQGLVGFHTC
jgi:acylphosphatase